MVSKKNNPLFVWGWGRKIRLSRSPASWCQSVILGTDFSIPPSHSWSFLIHFASHAKTTYAEVLWLGQLNAEITCVYLLMWNVMLRELNMSRWTAFCFPRRFYVRGFIFGDCLCILLPCEVLGMGNLYVKRFHFVSLWSFMHGEFICETGFILLPREILCTWNLCMKLVYAFCLPVKWLMCVVCFHGKLQ